MKDGYDIIIRFILPRDEICIYFYLYIFGLEVNINETKSMIQNKISNKPELKCM
jgi:hypothetical protein